MQEDVKGQRKVKSGGGMHRDHIIWGWGVCTVDLLFISPAT